MNVRRAGLTTLCALVMGMAGAAEAHAFIYFNSNQGPTILRADADGTGLQPNFIAVPGAKISRVAVDAGHIYWADRGSGSIGRAALDGSGVQPDFIPGAGGTTSELIQGVAVDAQHVYWTVGSGPGGPGGIGRANLDGSGATRSFIPDITAIEVAVDAGHVYWTGFSRIGRANLDGSAANGTFIDASVGERAGLLGLAVGADHLFWSNDFTDKIGRANLDGTGVQPAFIAPGGSSPTLQGVAVDAEHVFWADTSGLGRVGRADLEGSGVIAAFVSTNGQPAGLAVDGAALRPTATTLSCTPGLVPVFGISTCTATVSDAGPGAPVAPTGTIQFASSHGSEGAFFPSSSCALTAGATPGTASCSRPYQPADPFDNLPRTDVLSAAYVPSGTTHAASSTGGAGAVHLEVVPPDTTAPTISCGAADGQWHADNVSIACTASDAGSGLADPGDASFTLSTSVAAGSENPNAATGSREVCDAFGNCAAAGPVAGNKVDRKAPSVTLVRPAATRYSVLGTLLAPVKASYSCGDAGSGIAACNGTQPNGATLNTGLLAILSSHKFTVTATDHAGNTTSITTTYTVGL